MATKTDLKKIILAKSTDLFQAQGYTATTIKQIAIASDCTTAALYYYFEGGKEEILLNVMRNLKGAELLDGLGDCSSLPDFLQRLTSTMAPEMPYLAEEIGWILLQSLSLPEEGRMLIRDHFLDIFHTLKNQLACFTPESEVESLAWIIFSSFVGYQMIFYRGNIQDHVDFPVIEFSTKLAELIKCPGDSTV